MPAEMPAEIPVEIPANEVALPFHGSTSGTGPLTWGQTAIWDVLAWLGPDAVTLNRLAWWELAAGTTDLDRVMHALSALVERHDSLRSRYFQGPDGPLQEVDSTGELSLRIYVHEDEGPAPSRENVGEQLRQEPFDDAHDLPIRFGLVTRAGVPEALFASISHMAVDGSSFPILSADLLELLAGRELGPAGQQPLERAEYEASETGLARERRALGFWADRLGDLPEPMLLHAGRADQPDFLWARMDSPAMALAARSLAARFAVEAGTPVLAGLALVLAGYTGETETALRLIVATRFLPASRNLVGAFNLNALFRVSVRVEPISAFVQQTAGAQLSALRNCEIDPRKLDVLMAQTARSRGLEGSEGYCFVNDVRLERQRYGAADPVVASELAAGIEAALPRTRISELPPGNAPKTANLFVHVHDTSEQAYLRLGGERRFLGPHGPAGFLRDLEQTLVRAADNPDLPATEAFPKLSHTATSDD